MKSIASCFFLLVIAVYLHAQPDSHIQVKAEPNISVFLNEEFKGKTNVEFGGLIIENLKAGKHIIKVVKDGFIPQSESVTLKPGEVLKYQVKPFIPRVKITQSGNEQNQTIELKTGSLIIQSLPVEINIEIIDLGVKSKKTHDEWRMENVPIGSYRAKYIWGNKYLIDTIRIEQDEFKHLFVNLIDGKIEIRQNLINGTIETYSNEELEETESSQIDPEQIHVVVEEMPQFPGGKVELDNYIRSNTHYPKIAAEENLHGKVLVRFCITSDGGISNVSILKGVHKILDAEAIRVVKQLPRWKPGRQGGMPVAVWWTIPIDF